MATVPSTLYAQQWSVREVARAGVAGPGSAPFSGISSIIARGEGFYVLDAGGGRLRSFDPAGEPRWSSAPGGTGKAMALLGLSNGELVLPDSQSNQFIVYDTAGSVMRRQANTRSPDLSRVWSRIGARPVGYDGWLYSIRQRIRTRPEAGYEGERIFALAWPEVDGPDIARVAVTPPVEMDESERLVLNGTRNEVILAGADDRLFVATAGSYRIDAYDERGVIINTLTRQIPRARATAKDRITARRNLAVMFDSMGTNKERYDPLFVLPDSAPVITAMVAGDSLLLVRRYGTTPAEPALKPGKARWDVFSFHRGYDGWFELDAQARVLAISDGRIYSAVPVNAATTSGQVVVISLLKRPGRP